MPTEKEMKKMELATAYELRLLFAANGKDTFTLAEVLEILDQYARDKNTPV